MGIELDMPLTLGSVTLDRIKYGRVTAIWIGDRYMRLQHSMKYKNAKKHSLQLVLSRVILLRYLIL